MAVCNVHQAEEKHGRGGLAKRDYWLLFCPLCKKGQTAGQAAGVPVRTSLLLTPAKSMRLKLARSRFCAVQLIQKLERRILIFSSILV